MRVPISWLKDYVNIVLPIRELAERLTLAGLEVEHIERIGGEPGRDQHFFGEVLQGRPRPHAARGHAGEPREGSVAALLLAFPLGAAQNRGQLIVRRHLTFPALLGILPAERTGRGAVPRLNTRDRSEDPGHRLRSSFCFGRFARRCRQHR